MTRLQARRMPIVRLVLICGASMLLLAGCAWDYLANSDQVSYSAGDAVKANLEAQTTNPSDDTQYDTTGLGKNGKVTPGEPAELSP